MSRALVIVSKSLAPYRIRFYREVARCLADAGWHTTLIVANAGASDHPWRDPGKGDSSLRIVEAGAQHPQGGLWRWARKVAKLPGDSASPSPRLFRELAACNPDVVWTHEYSPFCLAAA